MKTPSVKARRRRSQIILHKTATTPDDVWHLTRKTLQGKLPMGRLCAAKYLRVVGCRSTTGHGPRGRGRKCGFSSLGLIRDVAQTFELQGASSRGTVTRIGIFGASYESLGLEVQGQSFSKNGSVGVAATSATDCRSRFVILDLSFVTVNGCDHIETILRESGFPFVGHLRT